MSEIDSMVVSTTTTTTTQAVEPMKVEVLPFQESSLLQLDPSPTWTDEELSDFASKALKRTESLFQEATVTFWKSGKALSIYKARTLHRRKRKGWTKFLKDRGINHRHANAAIQLFQKFTLEQISGLQFSEALALGSPTTQREDEEEATGEDSAAAESSTADTSNEPPTESAAPTANQPQEPAQVDAQEPTEAQDPESIENPVVRTPAPTAAPVEPQTIDRQSHPLSYALSKFFEKKGASPRCLASVLAALAPLEAELLEAGMSAETAAKTVKNALS